MVKIDSATTINVAMYAPGERRKVGAVIVKSREDADFCTNSKWAPYFCNRYFIRAKLDSLLIVPFPVGVMLMICIGEL